MKLRTCFYSHLFILTCLSFVSGCATNSAQPPSSNNPAYTIVQSEERIDPTLKSANTANVVDAWNSLIHMAKNNIFIETLYACGAFDPDMVSVYDNLKQKAAQGVSVTILLDTAYTVNVPSFGTFLQQFSNIPNISIYITTRPTPFHIHTKLWTIDGGKAFYMGSHDLSDKVNLYSDNLGVVCYTNCLSFGTQLYTGQQYDLQSSMITDTTQILKKQKTYPPNLSAQTYSQKTLQNNADPELGVSPKDFAIPAPSLLPVLLSFIDNAKHTLDMKLYTIFTSTDASTINTLVMEHLLQAQNRGVRIRLIVSNKQTYTSAASATLAWFADTLHIPVQVVSLGTITTTEEPYISHAKYIIADHTDSIIMSANFSYEYWTQFRDWGIVLHDPTYANTLDTIFTATSNSSYTTWFANTRLRH
jgi:phosphatidylserine/phosphatidylglycerophosphate/cardiolipin synthase-like enzyme